MAVDKKHQNNGFGKNIVSQYLSILPDDSIVFLEVNKNNYKALKIYNALGFKKIGSRKNYYNNIEDALIMRYFKNTN